MTNPNESTNSLFRKLAKGGGLAFAGQVTQLGISFIGAAIIARLIGPLNFGAVALGSTILTTLSTVSLLGLQTGVARYLPRAETDVERRGIVRSAVNFALPMATLAGVAVVLLSGFLSNRVFDDPSLEPVLVVFGLGIPFAALMRMMVGITQGEQRVIPRVLSEDMTLPVMRLTIAGVALILGYNVIGVSIGYSSAYVFASLVGVYTVTRRLSFSLLGDYTRMYRELLVFSAPLMITQIMGRVLKSFDTFLLGYYLTTDQIGIYGVVYPLASLVLVSLSSAGFIFMPVISELHSQNEIDQMANVYRTVTKWIFLGTIPLFLLLGFFPRTMIFLTYGSEYVSGALTLSILTIGFLVHVALGPMNGVLTSVGYTRVVMYLNSSAAILNVMLNIVLIPEYGILGAGVATAVSYTAMNLAYLVVLYKYVGFHPFTSAMLKPGVAALGTAVAVRMLTERLLGISIFTVLSAAVLYVGLYVVLVLKLGGIQEQEIQLLLDVEHKLGIDLGPLKTVVERLM